jgi:ubiquinol-cytochrome c reductase cytochrome b subunit
MFRSARDWVFDRFGIEPIWHTVFERPEHRTPWYYSDGTTLLALFGILVVTGMTMTLYYSASPESAYQSVQYITDEAPLGGFVRGLHYWSAGGMMLVAWIHLFRVVLIGGYKPPREGTWLIGVGLLFSIFFMSFTGYLLRWDERGVYAFILSAHMFQHVPILGPWLVLLVQGGPEIGGWTLTRIYSVHVIWVPGLMGALVAYHMFLVIRKGTTSHLERATPIESAAQQEALHQRAKHESGEMFWPDTTAKIGLVAGMVFLLVVGLALFIGPMPLYPEANLVEPTMPQGEWWFWWYSGLIALIPGPLAPVLIVLFPPLLFLALVLLPFLDRNPHRAIRRRPWIAVVVLGAIGVLVATSLNRWQSPWTGWPQEGPPPVPAGVVLAPTAREGRLLFHEFGCTSCHAVDGAGPQVGRDLMGIGADYDRDTIRNYIVNPAPDIPMPQDYGRRLTPDQLEALVDYLAQLR